MFKSMSIMLAVVLLLGTTVLADWNPGDPAKWVQLPDLQPTGVDVKATYPKVLADDFLCTSTGPITDIHIWGSWLYDRLPVIPGTTVGDPNNVSFRLSIH